MIKTPAQWLAEYEPTPPDIDCSTTVMLKILDGKCKMSEAGKLVMIELYDLLREQTGIHLGGDSHRLIANGRAGLSDGLRLEIYEQRLLAETMISRPVMKAFKARLREAGVIGSGVAV